ncbi:MAG: tetratricopeptide repeat protein, partial [Planctomycetota bacterium]
MSTYRDQALYQLGEIHFQQKKYDDAIRDYQTLISQQATSSFVPAAWYGIAAAQFEKADYPSAVNSLNTLVNAHPQAAITPRGKYLRGLSQLRLGQHQAGLQDLTEFIAAKPPEADLLGARFALARCQIGLTQFDAAIAGLNALLAEKPDYERADDVYYEVAFAYLATSKPKEAADAFRTLAQKLPASPRAAESWYRVGEYLDTQNQMPEAAAAYVAGLTSPPEPAVREKLYYKLGTVQHKQKQHAVAVITLDAQLKEFPADDLAFAASYLAGESLYAQDKFQEALTRLSEVAASVDPKALEFRARSLYRCGTCAANLKQWAVSQQHYTALIAQFPKFELLGDARYGLGMALQSDNKLDEAKVVFKQAIDAEPNSETAMKSWFMTGQCWFAQKKYSEAIDCFSEVAFGFKHEEWQPLSYFEAGRCYIQLNDPAAARKMLTTVVEEFPKHERVHDAKTILAQLDKS